MPDSKILEVDEAGNNLHRQMGGGPETGATGSGWGTSRTPIALQNDIGALSAQTLPGLTGGCPNGLDAPLSRKCDLPFALAAHDAAHTKQHASSAFDTGKTLCRKHDDQ